MINPQSHNAHYFCHLHEYSAQNVQEMYIKKKHQLYLPIQ